MGVFGHALVFGLAPLLRRLAALVLLPLYTHYLSPADYGEIELLSIATGLASTVLQLELRQGYLRAWVRADPAGQGALFASVVQLMAVLATGGAVALFALAGPVSAWLLGRPISAMFAGVLAVGLFSEVLGSVFQATMQAQLHSATSVVLGVGQFVVGAGLTVVGVVGFRLGPIGFFIGGAAAQLLVLVVMAGVAWRHAPPRRGPRMPLGPLVRYALPLLGAALLFFVVRTADRVAVARLLSVAELGVYAMAWTLANMLMTAVFLPLQTSLEVWRHRMHALADGAAQFAEVHRRAMLVMGAAAAGLVTFGLDLFVAVSDRRFAGATALVPALSVAVLLQAGYSVVASAFFVSGATARWAALFAVAAAVQVGGSWGAVSVWGVAGAPVGIVAANALLYAGAAWWGRALWPVPYRHGVVLALVLLLPAVAVLRRALPLDGAALPVRLLADAGACLSFAAAAYALRLYGPTDVQAVARAVQGRALAGWHRLALLRG